MYSESYLKQLLATAERRAAIEAGVLELLHDAGWLDTRLKTYRAFNLVKADKDISVEINEQEATIRLEFYRTRGFDSKQVCILDLADPAAFDKLEAAAERAFNESIPSQWASDRSKEMLNMIPF